MALGDRLIHVATPVVEGRVGDRVEGEHDVEQSTGAPFDCLFLMPGQGRTDDEAPRGRRKVTRPILLYEPVDQEGDDFVLNAEDELLLTAEELGMEEKRVQVDGPPLPLAKPGELIGYEAFLRFVED